MWSQLIFYSAVVLLRMEQVAPAFAAQIHSYSGTTKAPASATVSVYDLHVPEAAAGEFKKGNKALAKNNFASAEEHYHKAIAKYPPYARAYNNLGVSLNRQNRTNEAEVAWRTAIAVDSHLASAYINLSELLTSEGRDTEAQLLRSKLRILDPRR